MRIDLFVITYLERLEIGVDSDADRPDRSDRLLKSELVAVRERQPATE